MPTTYALADPDLLNLLARVKSRHHPRLYDAGVKVGVLLAYNADGPALKRGGHEMLAHIRPVPLKDRITKGYDAELVIDGAYYERLREGQRAALLDHELSRIDTIDRDPDGADPDGDDGDGASRVTWRTDDLGRPRLTSVPGDWMAGEGFADVIARHGGDAIEYEMLSRCKSRADAARRAGEEGRDLP